MPDWWTFYYLYAYERYASFRELAEGRTDKEPAWYNDGARFLLKKQEDNGSWTHEGLPFGKDPRHGLCRLVPLAFLEAEHREGLRLRREHVGGRPRALQGDRRRDGLAGQGASPCRSGRRPRNCCRSWTIAKTPPSTRRLPPWTSCRRKRRRSWRRTMPRCSAAWSPTAPAGPHRRGQGHRQRQQSRPGARADLRPGRSRRGRGREACDALRRLSRTLGTRPVPDAADRAAPPRRNSILEAMVPGDPAGGGIRHLNGCFASKGAS